MKKQIYFDYAATTPVDPRVIKAMLPYLSKKIGNTMSGHHFGREAAETLEKCRQTVAQYINAQPEEIIFTSSATESNNLALKGIMMANKGDKNHLVVTQVEHDCVLNSAHFLEKQGFKVTYLSVNKNGFIDIKELEKAITPRTALVSIIHGNNEIGTIQDIETIGKLCHSKGAYFHTDASQSLGKVDIDVVKMNIDLLTASSHKIYGPKGVGLLYVKKGTRIQPIIHGGGQEFGMRSSTVNLPAIVGFAKAVEICQKEGKKENARLTKMRDFAIKSILKKIPATHLNGDPVKRLSNNINISFNATEGESLMMELDFNGISVSTGSACSSKTLMPSHVLMALGLPPQEAHGSLRISLGRFTKEDDVRYLINTLVKVTKKIRKFSPFANLAEN